MSLSLYQISDEYLKAFLEMADSDLPDEVINDTLEGMEGEIVDKGKNVIAFILNLEAEADAMRSAEKRIAERRQSIQKKVERFKEYLRFNMERTGITEITANDGSFKAKLYPNRDESVVIDDESKLSDNLMRIKKEPDKTAIKVAIKEFGIIEGAHIERKSRLEIK